ncbi:hypothetical protein [Streptomyces luteogriseus]|uniref:hypothetical protein n=1 Tax=Streptomyces luteogriseus TaxID=68233 RepID=UPI0036881687
MDAATLTAADVDLPAEQATAQEIAVWARGHWIIENTVHWTTDAAFAETPARSPATAPLPS